MRRRATRRSCETLDDLSTDYLARRSVEPAEALKAILEINRALGGGAELNEVLGRALDALMAVFPSADRGFILIAGPEGRPRLRAFRQRAGQRPASRALACHPGPGHRRRVKRS